MRNFISTLFIALALTLSSFQSLQAQTGEMPFAGIVSVPTPCTCSPGLIHIWLTPLYLGGPVSISGPMVYSPYSTLLFADFMIGVPGTWHLGSYVPVTNACWIATPTGCVVLPSIGLMTKVGTNRLGF